MPLEPEKALVADITGVFQQHATMWGVYNDSIRLLVTVSALPLLAAAALLASSHAVDLMKLEPLLAYTLIFTPFLVFPILGVVIHYRLDILWYARALNGYRKIYFDELRKTALPGVISPMPVDGHFPQFFEPTGPMGLVVHGSALVNGVFLVFGWKEFMCWTGASVIAVLFAAAMEGWYWWNCKSHV